VLAVCPDIELRFSLATLSDVDDDGIATLEPMGCGNLSPIRSVESANESLAGAADNDLDEGERDEGADVDNDDDGATHDDEDVDADCEDGDDAAREADDEDVDEGGVDDDDKSAPARVE
jgi:hypothetical protein